MRRSRRQKVIAAAAVAVLLLGGGIAAVSATGQGDGRGGPGAGRAARLAHARAHGARRLDAVASYLGISPAQLASELGSGKTLAQIASATPGKSAQGLVDSLLATRRARLAAIAARLPARVRAEVNRPGGPASLLGARRGARAKGARLQMLFASPKRPGAAAAAYLGIAPTQLQAELRAGKSLAEVADATAGKSSGGLVEALVASRRARLEHALAAGRLPQAKFSKRSARLPKLMGALVQRKLAGESSSR